MKPGRSHVRFGGCGFCQPATKNGDHDVPGRISVLSEEVANQIAAGEVVERPASIVKELVENAVDAGATDIRVELEEGGCRTVRVIDNGAGIEHEDVALVFERHATSKIARLDDLYRIGSFGFRGEAMASIASIARVELLTRRPDDLAGTKAIAEAGAIFEIAPAGCPVGTSITVTKVFDNVPARRKFLKTQATEQAACLDAMERLSLSHPEIRFTVIADGREALASPKARDIAERVGMVMGREFARHCLPVFSEKDRIHLSGFVSAPSFSRSNSKNIYLFVNARFVRDTSLTHAILSAYRQVIEPRRYPAAVLFLNMPGEEVDINVHPAKLEVRFKNAREIYDLVGRATAQALAQPQMQPEGFVYRLDAAPTSGDSATGAARFSRIAETVPYGLYGRSRFERAINEDLFARGGRIPPVENILEKKYDDRSQSGCQNVFLSGRVYLGSFADTYLVFAGSDGLTLIDQHAAHERIILERLKASSSGPAASQPLLAPEVVPLAPAQVVLLESALPLLSDAGLDVEIFGRDAVAVKALPAALGQADARALILDVADQLAGEAASVSWDDRRDRILASLACRAAVKAHQTLSSDEVAALCRDLEKTPFAATCPHGRPTMVTLSLYEIERLFKRK